MSESVVGGERAQNRTLVPEEFEDVVLERGQTAVVLEYIGEGYGGDYDAEDPEDDPLIRFSVYHRNSPGEFPEGFEPVDDASYCTEILASTPRLTLQRIALSILYEVQGDVDSGMSIKKRCERLSWITPDNLPAEPSPEEIAELARLTAPRVQQAAPRVLRPPSIAQDGAVEAVVRHRRDVQGSEIACASAVPDWATETEGQLRRRRRWISMREQDGFLFKENCDRCGASLRTNAYTMSVFNQQAICMACKEIEMRHPAYPAAHAAEVAAVRQGNYNFSGVGLPTDLRTEGEARRRARTAAAKQGSHLLTEPYADPSNLSQ